MNNAAAREFEYNKVVPFKVITSDTSEKKKVNKDGSECKIHSNKIAGESSEVYAFKTEEEIKAMIDILNNHIEEAATDNQRQIAFRNKLLFVVGINVGIRASDLRELKWSFFFEEDEEGNRAFKDSYKIMPKKTAGKRKYVTLYFNNTVKTIIQQYISEYPVEDLDSYLFPSRKGNEPVLARSLWRIISDTAIEAGIEQNIGSHSLRKTFGFWRWHEAEDKDKALVILSKLFNHSSVSMTRKYIGILDEEIEDMFNSVELGFGCI